VPTLRAGDEDAGDGGRRALDSPRCRGYARAVPRLAIGSVVLSEHAPRIVAAGGEAELDALVAADGADLVELRADLCDDPRPQTVPLLLARLRTAGRPVILTARGAAEGGRLRDDGLRRALYEAALADADAIDVEIASTALVGTLVPKARAAGKTVILSAHALDATPRAEALIALVDRAEALGADVTKLATHADGLDDLRTLIEVTLATRERGIVTLAMGPAGPLSRLVLPAAGSLLTYGHVGRPTAPSGQPSVEELSTLIRRLFPT
jgi:3-dehydroquinate dehydratase I